jgi:purine-binding chemotaxis protein CheW
MENQLVIFELASEHYGLNIAAVESIIKMQTITTVPHAPHFVEGVTNLRGQVLPVVDLRRRFDLSQKDESKDTRIIVVEINGSTVGMIVDAVTEVLRVADESIEPPSPLVTTVDSAFIIGVAKLDERLVILLDLAKVFNSQEQNELEALPVAA